MSVLPSYVLITPARDEAKFIESTLQSVVLQTITPLRWVIVSDGSKDGTDEIVRTYALRHPWIHLVRMPERRERHFAGKVHAFNAGYAELANLPYEIIGNLDADVSVEPDYFEFLLGKFVENPKLGVAGTPFREGSYQYDYRFTSIEHVSGQCQIFRRQCFEGIGGYIPRNIGGIDLVAVTSARMKGWQTRTFVDKPYVHQRQMGTATANFMMAPFKVGRADRLLGSHPLWELARSMYQMTRPPILFGGVFRLTGYLWEVVRRSELQVPPAFVEFRRREQMHRLHSFLTKIPGKRPLNVVPQNSRTEASHIP